MWFFMIILWDRSASRPPWRREARERALSHLSLSSPSSSAGGASERARGRHADPRAVGIVLLLLLLRRRWRWRRGRVVLLLLLLLLPGRPHAPRGVRPPPPLRVVGGGGGRFPGRHGHGLRGAFLRGDLRRGLRGPVAVLAGGRLARQHGRRGRRVGGGARGAAAARRAAQRVPPPRPPRDEAAPPRRRQPPPRLRQSPRRGPVVPGDQRRRPRQRPPRWVRSRNPALIPNVMCWSDACIGYPALHLHLENFHRRCRRQGRGREVDRMGGRQRPRRGRPASSHPSARREGSSLQLGTNFPFCLNSEVWTNRTVTVLLSL